ncbi:MAG: metallophosphoesterase [Hyphomicrobiaceae bacterium]
MRSPQPPSLLVFGGPYSNLRALAALRGRADALGIDATHVICTGDVVAYCAEPEETIGAIRDWGCRVVAGNCEEQLAAGADDCGCGFAEDTACDRAAKDWFSFADRRVGADSRRWMAGLPRSLAFVFGGWRFRVVHGGSRQINRFVFASDRAAIAEELDAAKAEIVVAGHCGLPFIRKLGGSVWFNPGVIGIPANDGTAQVWFGLVAVEDDALVLSTHRLDYDHDGAAAATRAAGHADGYAAALLTGLWPSLDVLPAQERALTGRPLAETVLRLPLKPGAGAAPCDVEAVHDRELPPE